MTRAIDYIRKEWAVIAICLVAILITMLTYLPAQKVLAECNKNCISQFKNKCVTGAEYIPTMPNGSIGIIFNSENTTYTNYITYTNNTNNTNNTNYTNSTKKCS